MKGNKIRLALILFLALSISAIQISLSKSTQVMDFYIHKIFLPLQKGRSWLFNKTIISIGDFLYLALFLLFLLILIRLIFFTFTYRRNSFDFWRSLLRFITFPLAVYFSFLILWGGNYSRKSISHSWEIQSFVWDTTKLINFNKFLIDKLNETVAQQDLHFQNLKTLNHQSNAYYHQLFGAQLPQLKVKPTSLGYLLNYIGIHGYYNPLTGEAQFNKFILPFMHSFVVSHEMAHQNGIAREDDANLLAYIIGVKSEDPSYRYSAYFNLFLYANSDLRNKNKKTSERLLLSLNPRTRKDLIDLREMYKKYKSTLRGFSNSLYEEYLLLHGQNKGLNSYNQVTKSVYYWEMMNHRNAKLQIL